MISTQPPLCRGTQIYSNRATVSMDGLVFCFKQFYDVPAVGHGFLHRNTFSKFISYRYLFSFHPN
jgi:hypothetical protein